MTQAVDKSKSEKISEELQKRKDLKQIVDVEEKKTKLVIFTLLDSYYALFGEDVKEILPLSKIYYVPGSPNYMLGIINVRGDIQSVVDIRIFLDYPNTQRTDKNRIVIAEKNGIRSGILVDSVEDVIDVPVSSIQQVISTLSDNIRFFIVGETSYKNNSVTLLDIGKLFEKINAE